MPSERNMTAVWLQRLRDVAANDAAFYGDDDEIDAVISSSSSTPSTTTAPPAPARLLATAPSSEDPWSRAIFWTMVGVAICFVIHWSKYLLKSIRK